MKFDHIGIATNDSDTLVTRYNTLLGTTIAHEEEIDDMKIVFLALGDQYFELLEPLTDTGIIASYLNKSGTNIHHIGIKTPNIEESITEARESGVMMIDNEPRAGAWGRKISFVDPHSTGGVLLELVEE